MGRRISGGISSNFADSFPIICPELPFREDVNPLYSKADDRKHGLDQRFGNYRMHPTANEYTNDTERHHRENCKSEIVPYQTPKEVRLALKNQAAIDIEINERRNENAAHQEAEQKIIRQLHRDTKNEQVQQRR